MSPTRETVVELENPVATFRLKGGLFPFTQLEIQRCDLVDFERELKAKVVDAPAFFANVPVIVSLQAESVDEADTLDLSGLLSICREQGLIPVALRGATAALREQALALGMALLPEGRARPTEVKEQVVEMKAAAPARVAEAPAVQNSQPPAAVNKVITTPVRSGQQVYAAGGDLIVLASVSTGAEVLADGNVHVYGALRGRALAGIKGDASARIFCQSLEAELVSIAGDFKLDEDFREEWWKRPVQISLDADILHIEPLG